MQYTQTILRQDGITLLIPRTSLLCIVMRTVQLDCKSCLRAVEIYYESTNHSLTVPFHGIIAEKAIP